MTQIVRNWQIAVWRSTKKLASLEVPHHRPSDRAVQELLKVLAAKVMNLTYEEIVLCHLNGRSGGPPSSELLLTKGEAVKPRRH